METGWYFVGLDLGQSRDFTVLAVLERAEVTGESDPAMFALRMKVGLRLRRLERAPLARGDAAGDAVSGDGGAGDQADVEVLVIE